MGEIMNMMGYYCQDQVTNQLTLNSSKERIIPGLSDRISQALQRELSPSWGEGFYEKEILLLTLKLKSGKAWPRGRELWGSPGADSDSEQQPIRKWDLSPIAARS